MDSTIQAQISLRRGTEAYSALDDDNFRKKWQALYLQCSWATPFQDYRFVSTWYRIYKDRFEPVILCEAASDGSLVGLLALANPKESGQLVVAGSHQAEYQVWLSTPERSTSFIEKALTKLQESYPGRLLVFKYLPPFVPKDWAANKRSGGPYCEVEMRRRPLLDMKNSLRLTELFRNKSTKNGLNRLKRLGGVQLEQISTSGDLALIFDQIIAYYDLRQGALRDSVPFKDDSLKRAFHLALMDIPGFLHITVLKVGNEAVAANLGLHDKDKVYLGVFAHSPFLARHSPGKLHLLMLGEKLAEGNYSALDLTPGDDPWKERFATAHEEAHVVTVYFSYGMFRRHRMHANVKAGAKYGLRFLGLTPSSARSYWEKLTRAGKLVRKGWDSREFRLYMVKCSDLVQLPYPKLMNRNCIEDLLDFQPSEPWETRQDFLASCLARLEEGCHVYTYVVEKGLLLHCGWLVPGHAEAFFPGVGQALSYPPGSVGLFDFYTNPKARGHGLYLSSLCQMLHDATRPGTERIYIAVPADDREARHETEKVGFDYQCSLFWEMKQWRTKP